MSAATIFRTALAAALLTVVSAEAQDKPANKPAPEPLSRSDKVIYPTEQVTRLADEYLKHAAEYYGFDEDQRDAARALLQDGLREYLDWWEMIDRLSINSAKAISRGEMTHEQLTKEHEPLIDRSLQVLDRMRADLRDHILDARQRQRFEEAEIKGRDPLNGRTMSFGTSRQRADSVENTAKRFTGRGFEEENWAAWLDRTAKAVRMTETQSAKAGELLREAKQATADYRRAKEADYRRLAAEWAELDRQRGAGKGDLARWNAFRAAGAELAAPVDAIGKRWREDVLGLLDETQRRAVARQESAAAGR